MERECLRIGKPEVVTDGEKSILRVEVDECGTKKTLEYRVDREYEQYLTWERSDAFVVSLLFYAMIKQLDIVWGVPCNEQLIYQLETFFIPVCAKETAYMHRIKLSGPTTNELLSGENGVATGISNGVDCSYTLHKYLNHPFSENRLTHVFFTPWYLTEKSEEYKKNYLEYYLRILPGCAEELGVKLVYVEMNLDEQFSVGHFQDEVCGLIQDAGLGTLKFCAAPMALQKMLYVYYLSSGFSASGFSFKADDVAHFDIFTLPLLTTKALRFYSSGMEATRAEKVAAISDWKYAKEHLLVCERGEKNCGRCGKCIRTMSDLYGMGKLDEYVKVFPVDDYKKNFTKRMAYVLARCKTVTDGQILFNESLVQFRENGYKIPALSYILCPVYILFDFARKLLSEKKWARRIYRRFNLDVKLYGSSTAGNWKDQKAGTTNR